MKRLHFINKSDFSFCILDLDTFERKTVWYEFSHFHEKWLLSFQKDFLSFEEEEKGKKEFLRLKKALLKICVSKEEDFTSTLENLQVEIDKMLESFYENSRK